MVNYKKKKITNIAFVRFIMDKISFKLNELDDVLEENIDKISKHLDYYDTEEDGNNSLVVRNYRIVIPDLHVSFREGDWYYRETENAAW